MVGGLWHITRENTSALQANNLFNSKALFSHTAGSHATLSTHLGSHVSRNVRLTFIQQRSQNNNRVQQSKNNPVTPMGTTRAHNNKYLGSHNLHRGGWVGRSGHTDGNKKNCKPSTSCPWPPRTLAPRLPAPVRNRFSAYFVPQPAENNTYCLFWVLISLFTLTNEVSNLNLIKTPDVKTKTQNWCFLTEHHQYFLNTEDTSGSSLVRGCWPVEQHTNISVDQGAAIHQPDLASSTFRSPSQVLKPWDSVFLFILFALSGLLAPPGPNRHADLLFMFCSLSLNWHLNRKTGEVIRMVDRGANSIYNLLRSAHLSVHFPLNPFPPELKKCILPTFQKAIVWVM